MRRNLCGTASIIFQPFRQINLYTKSKTTQKKVGKPTVEVGDDSFKVTMHIGKFDKDEICVKANPGYVSIEGKQEREEQNGILVSKFTRKFRLPNNCRIDEIDSRLSSEGILTVNVPRTPSFPSDSYTVVAPIITFFKHTRDSQEKKRKMIPYPKVKPLCPSTGKPVPSSAKPDQVKQSDNVPKTDNVPKADNVPTTDNVPKADNSNAYNIPKCGNVSTDNISKAYITPKTEIVPKAGMVPNTDNISKSYNMSKPCNVPITDNILKAYNIRKTGDAGVPKTDKVPKSNNVPKK